MPSSITIAQLSYTGPDGHSLFTHLDLTFGPGRTGLVGRNGVGKTTLLRLVTGELAPAGGSISVHGRLGLLRQRLQPEPGETIADLFGIGPALDLLARAEAGTAGVEELAEADWTLESRVEAALQQLGLDAAPETSLSTLSGGQRTRAALAALVFGAPDIIVLDEPTNNLDADGRESVVSLLKSWHGAALVVSHDRELLEEMDAIVELTGLGATSYGGNFSHYEERKALELAAAQHDLSVAERNEEALQRAAQEARERQARREGNGRRAAARGGIPKIVAGGLKRRAEGTSGRIDSLAERRGEAAAAQSASARSKIEVLTPFAVKLAPTGLPAGKVVLRATGLTGGYDPGRPVIRDHTLDVIGPERVAIAGPNGAGKTTLLKLLTGAIEPLSGQVQRGGPIAFLDQQVALLDRTQSIVDNFSRLNPGSSVNDCRSVLAAFKFRNDAALQQVATLSGGEMIRAALACVLGGSQPPLLLVLDEPTNHLDIEAVGVVEAGLRAYDGALLVVSHDPVFMRNVGVTREVRLG